MKFDLDRFSKLAGLEQDKDSSSSTVSRERTNAPGLMSEGRRQSNRLVRESADMQKLRAIIRRETAVVLKQMNESRSGIKDRDLIKTQSSKKLTEAIAMGFYGPGFGGNKQSILGGPMTSAFRINSIIESDEEKDPSLEEEDENLEDSDLRENEEDDESTRTDESDGEDEEDSDDM